MTSKPYNPFATYIDLTKFVTRRTDSRDVSNSPRDVPEFQVPNTQMIKVTKFNSDTVQVNPISPCEPSGLDARPITEPIIWEQSLRCRGISNSSEDSEGSPKSYPTDYGCGSMGAAGGIEHQNFEAAGSNYNLSEVAQLVQQMVHQEIRSSRYRMGCVFCKKNGETYEYYSTHVLKDNRGKVVCPILRKYTCPTCQATGDSAHTQRHCPLLNAKVFGK